MKIAHLISTFPPRIGGMGQVCYEEVKRLTPEFIPTVFTLDYGENNLSINSCHPALDARSNGVNFEIIKLKSLFRIGDGAMLGCLTSRLRGFDIVHLHYPFYGALGGVIRAKKILGFKLVITYHMDPQGFGLKRFLQNTYDWYYGKQIFRMADLVLAVNVDHFKASKFGRFIGKEKVKILPNAVNTELFYPGPATWAEVNLPNLASKKTLLFIGNLLKIKNVDFVINLLLKLPAEYVLVIIGSGYDESNIKNLITEQGLKERVILVGSVPHDQLGLYYKAASLVVVPSISESFSLTTLEAMSSGALVLANDIVGLNGRIKNFYNGFLAGLNDEVDWLDKIKIINNLTASDADRIRQEARQTASLSNWDTHISSLKRMYREL